MEKQPVIIVCNATRLWVAPNHVLNKKYVYVIIGQLGEALEIGVNRLVQLLKTGYFGLEVVEPDLIGYYIPIKGFSIHLDGHFGRPSILAEFWYLEPFSPEQQEELRQCFA